MHLNKLTTAGTLTTCIGIDAGGTHTDAVFLHNDTCLASVKVPTQHDNVPATIHAALSALHQQLQAQGTVMHSAQRITLGTTLAINALVQDKLPPVGLFLTAGQGRDPLDTAMGMHVCVVEGGLDHRGQEVIPIAVHTVAKQAQKWYRQGLRHFAVVGKFSVRNNAHEKAIAESVLYALPPDTHERIHLTQGHKLSGALNFPRRVATAYFNVAVEGILANFLDAVEESLNTLHIHVPVYLLKADGGSLPSDEARRCPVESLLSGPAASTMGLMAHMKKKPMQGDALLLDMGGTTTDMAVLVDGIPLLERDGMQLAFQGAKHKTHVRSLATLSLPMGGDSLVTVHTMPHRHISVGPVRAGAAVAFGGSNPTLLDAALVLQPHESIGQSAYEKSLHAMTALAHAHNVDIQTLAQDIVDTACEHIKEGIEAFLHRINGHPVYTLAQLLEEHSVRPRHVYFVGGPAHVLRKPMERMIYKLLGSPLTIPPLASVMNGIGAALTLPTLHAELFADTLQGFWHIPRLGLSGKATAHFSIDEACNIAVTALREHTGALLVDITQAHVFAILDTTGRSGKDIRVRCQVRSGVKDM